jgi:hypothetical protein
VSNEARNKDIAALLARGVIRVKKQPLVAKAIESQMPAKHEVSNISQNSVNNDSQVSRDQVRDGGDEYDDGGFSGGNIERPALKRLMEDIQAGKIDCVVVYKVDRLSRSLLDFARVMETFDKFSVSFVSVTQHFNPCFKPDIPQRSALPRREKPIFSFRT